MVLAGVPSITACNLVTGADDVRISDDDDEGSSSGATGGGGTQEGAQQAATSSGSGMGGNTTTASGMQAATTSTTSSAASGGGMSPTNCDYPPGPYGVDEGQVVPPTLSWQGYAPGASSPSTITMEDFHDCDGTGGIDAIIIDTSQYG